MQLSLSAAHHCWAVGGGYGFTVIGVLVLQVLTSFLVGIGLQFEGQQFVFGLIILPMVALYARSAHIRTQI